MCLKSCLTEFPGWQFLFFRPLTRSPVCSVWEHSQILTPSPVCSVCEHSQSLTPSACSVWEHSQTPHMVSYVFCVGALSDPHTFFCVLCVGALSEPHTFSFVLCVEANREHEAGKLSMDQPKLHLAPANHCTMFLRQCLLTFKAIHRPAWGPPHSPQEIGHPVICSWRPTKPQETKFGSEYSPLEGSPHGNMSLSQDAKDRKSWTGFLGGQAEGLAILNSTVASEET